MFSNKIKNKDDLKLILDRNINMKKKIIKNQKDLNPLPEIELREVANLGETTSFVDASEEVQPIVNLQVLQQELKDNLLNGNELLKSWQEFKKKYQRPV
jgi:hypothetical protein